MLTDWPALFCLISIPGAWVVGYAFPFMRQGAQFGAFEMLAVALPLSLLAAGFLLWRILRIRHLFTRGAQVRGFITPIQFAQIEDASSLCMSATDTATRLGRRFTRLVRCALSR